MYACIADFFVLQDTQYYGSDPAAFGSIPVGDSSIPTAFGPVPISDKSKTTAFGPVPISDKSKTTAFGSIPIGDKPKTPNCMSIIQLFNHSINQLFNNSPKTQIIYIGSINKIKRKVQLNFSIMKKVIINSVALVCFLLSLSCKDDNEKGVDRPPHDPSKPVVLTTFFPDSGQIREKVILEGDNFGSDPEQIRVYFNYKRAKVVGSVGNQMYVIVPRLPGDTCVVCVKVGDAKDSVFYDARFRYKLSSQSSTIAGTGYRGHNINGNVNESSFPMYGLAVDDNSNIFFLTDGPSGEGAMVMFNEEEQLIREIFRNKGTGWAQSPTKRLDQVMIFPSDQRMNDYYVVDKKRGYAPLVHSVVWKRNYDLNDYERISGPVTPAGQTRIKNAMAYCEEDEHYYTYYRDGSFAKIDPQTDTAQVLAVLPPAFVYGMAFHPSNRYILYMSMSYEVQNNELWPAGEKYRSTICRLDVRDPLGTFENVTGMNGEGHQDGFLAQAKFKHPWQMYFDSQELLYVADARNFCIRRINLELGTVETVIGIPGESGYQEGTMEEAKFGAPLEGNGIGICVGPDDVIYIGDDGNARLRKLAVE
jgi:hypothetical protein